MTIFRHWQVRKAGLRAVFVFIAPPSIEELEKRLRGRATEEEAAVQGRVEAARQEIARCANSYILERFGSRDVELEAGR